MRYYVIRDTCLGNDKYYKCADGEPGEGFCVTEFKTKFLFIDATEFSASFVPVSFFHSIFRSYFY